MRHLVQSGQVEVNDVEEPDKDAEEGDQTDGDTAADQSLRSRKSAGGASTVAEGDLSTMSRPGRRLGRRGVNLENIMPTSLGRIDATEVRVLVS